MVKLQKIMRMLIPGLVLLTVLAVMPLKAQRVSPELATHVAQSWITEHAPYGDFALQFRDSLSLDDRAAIYLFDLQPGGFIWISANWAFAPVLAYSFESSVTTLEEESPAYAFLESYRNEMSAWQLEPDRRQQPHPDWTTLPSGDKLKSLTGDESVTPMMQVLWGQGTGYNTYTPENTPTGCVAVAMVQLMRHWEWPPQGKGEHSYTHQQYGDFAVNFDTIAFNWSSLPLTSPSPEIARIMLWAGIALHMNYAPGGSGAQTERVKELLQNNFRYNGSQIRYSGLADFGNMNNWILLIKNELINGRPLVYSGHGTAGHAFNIDGFNGDHFHLNWGWSGAHNGYFMLTALNPGSHNFSSGQGAVLRAFPDTLLMWDRPFSVRAIASDAKATLAWTAIYNRERLAYNIYRDGNLVGQTNGSFYTDTTARNGTTYHYAITSLYRTDTADYESELSTEFILTPVEGFKLPFDEDFEEDYAGWQISATARGFNWGTAAQLSLGSDTTRRFIGINSAQAGSNVLVTDRLVSNGIDLSKATHAVISFDYMFRKWQDVDQLFLLYRVFEDDEWVEVAELDKTKGYDDWVRYKGYLPVEALKENVQIAFYYTDNGKVGYGAGLDNIRIEQVTPGVPDFSVSRNIVCLNTEVVFTDRSGGTRESYTWSFGDGAQPRTATGPGPHTVSYRSPGEKTVTLVLNDLDLLARNQAVTIVSPPNAGFMHTINQKTVSFNNTSNNALAWMWDFGNGVRVTQKSPVHVYALSGDYLVQLIAINHTCENDTIQKWISIKITGIDDPAAMEEVYLYPNPADEWLNIHWPLPIEGSLEINIFSLDGRLVKQRIFRETDHPETLQVNIGDLGKGSYFIRLRSQGSVRFLRFVK